MQHIPPRRSQHQQQRAAPIAANIECEPKRNSGNLAPGSAAAPSRLFRKSIVPDIGRSQTALKQTERAHNEAVLLPVINSTDQNRELASQA